ncbi:MAG TPA: Gfo/Idh/MocA family oxidoreductase [Fimbriimonas sp.]
MARLRVALVGCGLISETHLNAYRKHADRAAVVACYDTDPERAARRAAEAGSARVASSLQEILDDPGVDAVDLLTPHHVHREQAVAALHAGKHVLLQKPLAHRIEDCEKIVQAANEADSVLFYGEMNHTAPAVLGARKAIADGEIGRLVATQSIYAYWQGGEILNTAWRYDPALAGGGQLLDGGIHQIAVMETAAGPIESVSAMTTRFRPELGGEDTASLAFRYSNGALGTFLSTHASALWPPSPSFVAFGTEGLLTIGGPYEALVLHRKDLPDRRKVLLEKREDLFATMVGGYLDAVLEGAPNPSTAEQGMREMQVALAAYRSAETGTAVRVEDVR